MQIRKAEQHMQTSLQGIAKRAKESPDYKFGNVYKLLNERNLCWCYSQLNRKSAPGVDGVDWMSFGKSLSENIGSIVEDLKAKRYRAKLVRRRNIPKPGGKQRPLGIPGIGDKVVQQAVASILSSIYEQEFLPFSHGYRRGKGPRKAAVELQTRLHRGKFRWIFDADIKGFFDNLDHEWLMRMLELRINDRAFLNLIRKWLKAGILEEDGLVRYPMTGTPQGGVVSAVLANIYLHYALDLWFDRVVRKYCSGKVLLMRFADDFVCGFEHAADLRRFGKVIAKRLGKFKLELSQEKTKTIRFSRFESVGKESFDFLGFTYIWELSRNRKPVIKIKTSKKKFQLALSAIKQWIRAERCRSGTTKIMERFRAKLKGHYNYYGVRGNSAGIQSFYYLTIRILFKWLNRRSCSSG